MSYTLKNQNNYNQQSEHQRMLGLLKNEICSPSFEGNYTYPYLDSAQQPNATIGCASTLIKPLIFNCQILIQESP